jgi:hypothetical protein
MIISNQELDYQTVSLYVLNHLCYLGDQEAIKEWERRWETEYPEMSTDVVST